MRAGLFRCAGGVLAAAALALDARLAGGAADVAALGTDLAGTGGGAADRGRRVRARRGVGLISAINRAGGVRGHGGVARSTAAAVIVAARGGGTGHYKE